MDSSDDASDGRTAVGVAGEQAVREWALAAGWRIVDHNVRWREGELDLIAIDRRTLVFAEVKTLKAHAGRPPFSPFESIDRQKQHQVRTLARRWLGDELRQRQMQAGGFATLRFDAFAVTLAGNGDVLEIEHLEDAF